MSKSVFQSNINALGKVSTKLGLRQTMSSSHVILGSKRSYRTLDRAMHKIWEAQRLLEELI